MKAPVNTLIIMIGLPQSGKSSESRQMGHPIVNRDAIRKTIGGSIRYYGDEKRVNEIERLMVESLFNAGHTEVTVDACHLKPSYRNAWKKFAEERGYRLYQFHVMTSLETCVMRAIRKFPDEPNFPEIIKKMWSKSNIDIGPIPEKQNENWS